MQTLKTKTIQSFIVALAGLVAVSVFLLSVHAKDLIQHNELMNLNRAAYHDINEKVASELHDHVDKKILKTPVKTFGDTVTMYRGRDDNFAPSDEQDPGIIGRIQETFLLWRVYASLPFAV